MTFAAAALPFAVAALCHASLGCAFATRTARHLRNGRLWNGLAHGVLALVEVLLVVDNCRRLAGGFGGATAMTISRPLLPVLSFGHLCLISWAFLAYGDVLAESISQQALMRVRCGLSLLSVIRTVSVVLAIILTAVGVIPLMHIVNCSPKCLALTSVADVYAYDPKPSPLDVFGVAVLGIGGTILGIVVACRGSTHALWVGQLLDFLGQAAGSASAEYIFFASNMWEVVFMASLWWTLWDGRTESLPKAWRQQQQQGSNKEALLQHDDDDGRRATSVSKYNKGSAGGTKQSSQSEIEVLVTA